MRRQLLAMNHYPKVTVRLFLQLQQFFLMNFLKCFLHLEFFFSALTYEDAMQEYFPSSYFLKFLSHSKYSNVMRS
jgi:hypothetical protein